MTLAASDNVARPLDASGFSAADVAAGRIPLILAGQTFVLPVRTIGENRAWQDALDAAIPAETADMESLLRAIAELDLLAHLYAYDTTGVLPPRAKLEPNIYPQELLHAVQLIRMAATPALSYAVGLTLDANREASPPSRAVRRAAARRVGRATP